MRLPQREVKANEAFDRSVAKDTMRKLILEADKVSAEIDSAMINTLLFQQLSMTPFFGLQKC